MSDHPDPPAGLSMTTRRSVLRAAGLAALAGGGVSVLGACSADGEVAAPTTSAPASSAPASSSAPATSAPASSSAPASASATESSEAPSGPSVDTADVPVGGGVILEDADYVITQPKKGTYKAFSKTCTHMRCPVASVSDGTINCSCHGSKFSIEDGSVSGPPATQPLPETKTVVSGKKVYVEV